MEPFQTLVQAKYELGAFGGCLSRCRSTNLIVMRDPNGKDFPNRGVYLEVMQNERLVFTDAYTKVWEASEKLFIME